MLKIPATRARPLISLPHLKKRSLSRKHITMECMNLTKGSNFYSQPNFKDACIINTAHSRVVASASLSVKGAYLQYLSISFCSSPSAFALFAIRFNRGYSNVKNPGTFISLMHTIIAVCFKCFGIDLLFVSPSAASP